jgi:hypothetical protein
MNELQGLTINIHRAGRGRRQMKLGRLTRELVITKAIAAWL